VLGIMRLSTFLVIDITKKKKRRGKGEEGRPIKAAVSLGKESYRSVGGT